jgi:cytochrome bd ubiquinol oxidase subunit I
MTESLDMMILLARMQFAFTISFHILFPALTIGLASYLLALEGLWLITRRAIFRELYDFWIKPFALSFGMGVVSGVVMSYQIGTNWSGFAEATGSVLGPLFGYEVLSAFFLEATFLGIMLFGRGRVSDWMHLLATALVALGTLLSAFWILAANSWMHTPAGYIVEGGRFLPGDWQAIIFNPSLPYRFVHMVLACYLSTALVVAGVGAFYLLRGTAAGHARVMLRMALPFIALLAPAQIIAGHQQGTNVLEHQPVKLAAMEGHWESHERYAPLILFALPDQSAERNVWQLAVPALGSLVVTGSFQGSLPGLEDWPPEERPPVAIVFWAFRLMVGLGLLMLAVGWIGSWLMWQGRLAQQTDFLRLCVAASPSGFLAVLAGWVTAEVGRQPYVVYGLLRTADAVSPVTASAVSLSLMVFLFAYAIIFGAGLYYLSGILRAGPTPELIEQGAPTAEVRTTSWAEVPGEGGEGR